MTAADGSANKRSSSKSTRRNTRKDQSATESQPAPTSTSETGTEAGGSGNVTPFPVKSPMQLNGDERYETHWLGDVEYRQYPSGVYGVARDEDGKLARPYPILPGHLGIDRIIDVADIERDGTPGDVSDTLWNITYSPPAARERAGVVSDADTRQREPEWATKLAIGSRVPNKKHDQVLNAVKAMSWTAERDGKREEGYSATGLLRRSGERPVFLRQGLPALTPDGLDHHAITELQGGIGDETGISALTLDDPSSGDQLGDDLLTMLGVLDVLPEQPYVPMALLGQLMWAPWSSDDELGRFATVIAGTTGMRKTALMGLFIAAQSRLFSGGDGIEVPVTVPARHGASSAIGTDRYLYPLRGMVAVVDDLFAGQMNGREIAQGWGYLSQVANNATTGAGGAKGARVGNQVRASRYPRGCPAFTAEELPDEDQHASEVNRTAAFKLETEMNLDALTQMQAHARGLSRAHAAMIQRGLSDLDAPRRALAWASAEVREWNVAGHNRARAIYSKILAGLKLYADHLQDVVEINPAPLLAEWSDALAEGADQQAHRCGMSHGTQDARDHVRLFTKHFLDLVGRDFWMADKAKAVPDPKFGGDATFQPAEIPGGYSPGVQGWRQNGISWNPAAPGEPIGAVYVDEGKSRPAWRAVELRMRAGSFTAVYERIKEVSEWPMPSEATVKAKLVEAGYLKSTTTERLRLWASEGTTKVLRIDLGQILDIEPDDGGNDDGGGGGGPEGPTEPEPKPEPEPEPAALIERRTCAGCGEAMTAIRDGQTMHPLCEPAPVGAPQEAQEPCMPAETPVDVPEAQTENGDQADEEQPGERRGYGVIGVLDTEGLYVSTGEVIEVNLSSIGNRGDLFELAEWHGIGQLWVHPAASATWGVPTAADRPADLAKDAGMPHEFAATPGTGARSGALGADPSDGVGPWNVVWRAGDRRGTSRSIVLVAQEERMPWSAADDGPTLLQAITRLNTALDKDFYWSPAATIRQFIGQHTYSARPNLAIQRGQVPPAVTCSDDGPSAVYRQMIRGKWARALTDDEHAATFVHRIDLSAAELAALNVPLGNDDAPEHWTGPITLTFARRKPERSWAGYWRVADGHDPAADAVLPRFRCEPGPDGGLWLTTPDVVLLADLGKLPELAEAYVWPRSVRALDATGKALREARQNLLAQRDDAAGELAYKALKPMYTNLIGNLARTAGPSGEADGLWRPDWRDMIQAQTYANMYRQLVKAGAESGRYPVAMNADAVYFVSYEHEARKAIPATLKFGDGGGQWKHEGCIPLAAVREHAESNRWFREFDAELDRKGVTSNA